MNKTSIIINGINYEPLWVFVLLGVLFFGGLGIGLLVHFVKKKNKKEPELPTPEPPPEIEQKEKIINLGLPQAEPSLDYDKYLIADIQKIKNEMKQIEREVETKRTDYCNLKSKLEKLEQIKKML